MTEGQPFTSTADQKTRGQVKLPSNTTLIGAGPGGGFVNAWINIAGVSNVIVRNLTIVAPATSAPSGTQPTVPPATGTPPTTPSRSPGPTMSGSTATPSPMCR